MRYWVIHNGTPFGKGMIATRIFLVQVSVFLLLWIKRCTNYVMSSHNVIVKSKPNFYKFTLMKNIQEKKISTEIVFSSDGLQLLRGFWYIPARPIFSHRSAPIGQNSNSLPPNIWDRTIYSRAQSPRFPS